jgi:hypothetical protein
MNSIFSKLRLFRDCPQTSISSSFWMILADFRSNFWGQYTSGRYCPQKIGPKIGSKAPKNRQKQSLWTVSYTKNSSRTHPRTDS